LIYSGAKEIPEEVAKGVREKGEGDIEDLAFRSGE
jgi:hypothetical protein